MIPIKQNRIYPKLGNCAAALASILEIPLSETFDGDEDAPPWAPDSSQFWLKMREWLLARNLMWAEIGHAPFGYAIAIGPSPRLRRSDGKPETHACVVLDGNLVHDPHPDNAFFGGEKIMS